MAHWAQQSLIFLRSWEPFRIDALGLITLLGASELDYAIGQLFLPKLSEYLPLLTPFVVSNNNFTKPVNGVTLYNITDGILATDVSGWVTRWLLNQDLSWSSATLIISPLHYSGTGNRVKGGKDTDHSSCSSHSGPYAGTFSTWFDSNKHHAAGISIASVAMIPILSVPVLLQDWFGLANAIGLLMTVLTRVLALRLNRKAIASSVTEGLRASSRVREMVKVVITLPGGKFVSLYCQRGILKHTILTAPRPDLWKYRLILGTSWVALCCHLVSIGMSALTNQIICVIILISSTLGFVLLAQKPWRKRSGELVYKLGDTEVGMVWRLSHGAEDGRSATYARLALTGDEEHVMCNWHLFPSKKNHVWWEKYYTRKEHNYELALAKAFRILHVILIEN